MDKEILNMDEAAELFNVSVKTFIKLLKEEKVPARKIGREWRFSRKALIEWLSSGDSQNYSSSEVEVKEFFNQVAPEWEEIRKYFNDKPIKDKILQMGILKKNMTVADFGSGDGYISRTVAPMVKKVIAVDISGEMLKQLSKKSRESGINNIVTIENDATEVSIEDNSVNIVFANMFLHHIENPETAIKQMYRVLKGGGTVFLSDFEKHSNSELTEKMHDLWQGFGKNEIKGWFSNAGFKNIKIEKPDSEIKLPDNNTAGIFILTAEK